MAHNASPVRESIEAKVSDGAPEEDVEMDDAEANNGADRDQDQDGDEDMGEAGADAEPDSDDGDGDGDVDVDADPGANEESEKAPARQGREVKDLHALVDTVAQYLCNFEEKYVWRGPRPSMGVRAR